MPRWKWCAIPFVAVLLASLGLMVWRPVLFPVEPPVEFHAVRPQMTLDEVVKSMGRPPDQRENDDRSWLLWRVTDGTVSIHLDGGGQVDMAFFHANRTSIYENVVETIRFGRRIR